MSLYKLGIRPLGLKLDVSLSQIENGLWVLLIKAQSAVSYIRGYKIKRIIDNYFNEFLPKTETKLKNILELSFAMSYIQQSIHQVSDSLDYVNHVVEFLFLTKY